MIGAGTVGLTAVMAARHRGVGSITVVEPHPQRRALALEVGATTALSPAEATDAALRASHVLDCVGSQSALDQALGALVPGGVCATVALHPGANDVTVSQTRLLWGRTLTGVIEGDADIARDIPLLVALWRAGRLPVERLVTAFDFADIADAVAAAAAGVATKAVVRMPGTPPAAGAPEHPVDVPGVGTIDVDELPALWRSLPPVAPDELRGLWRGTGLSRGHAAQRLLERSRWYGKLFRAAGDVAPIVCTDDAGRLVADAAIARGGATLIRAEHDGVRTAAMVYDGQPIIDYFTRLAPDAVLGVMTGPHTVDAGRRYYFVLHQDSDRPVADADEQHTFGHR